MARNPDHRPPPTIGHLRSMGLVALIVRCSTHACPNPPRRLTFDDLRLADATIYIEVATRHRRFVCGICGRRSTQIDLDWRDHRAEGNGWDQARRARRANEERDSRD